MIYVFEKLKPCCSLERVGNLFPGLAEGSLLNNAAGRKNRNVGATVITLTETIWAPDLGSATSESRTDQSDPELTLRW